MHYIFVALLKCCINELLLSLYTRLMYY
jgi:hypothetical protein